MDYKEKIKEAKRLYETANADQKYVLESLFPELAGSEDERILEIIKHCIESRYLHTSTIKGISQKQCFAWLEKQGKQKPIIEMKSAEESLGIDSDIYNEIVDECIYGEQKYWSEEDEKMVDNILTPLATRCPFEIYQPMYNWLKALKQRIGG